MKRGLKKQQGDCCPREKASSNQLFSEKLNLRMLSLATSGIFLMDGSLLLAIFPIRVKELYPYSHPVPALNILQKPRKVNF